MGEHKFRCGDTVCIEGADYYIEVAYADYESGRASWCGWPEGSVEIAKLALVAACSDEEHRKAVAMWLDRPRSTQSDHRRDAVERLYRPRAYWLRMVKDARVAVNNAVEHQLRCEELLRRVIHGPPDVNPISPAPAQEGTVRDG